MSSFLRQSTASQVVWLGPFIDTAGAAVAGLSIANTDIKLRPHGSTSASSKNSGGATHDANGNYYTTLDATDTATVGRLRITVVKTGALIEVRDFFVLEEAIYDALFAASATGLLPANATQIGGQAVGLSSDNRLRVDVAEWNDIPLATTNPLPNAAADAAGGLPISDAGGLDMDAILADTNELQTNQGDWATATGFSTHSAADVWAVATRVLTANTNLNDPTAAAIRAEIDSNSTQLAAIVADTNELQTNQGDWATATGFATPTNVTDAQSAIISQGNTAWATATGFAVAGDEMDFVDAPNNTAITAIQNGLATGTALQTVDDEIAAIDTVVDGVKVVTDALTAAAAAKLALSAGTIVSGTVDTGAFTATTTEFEADDITEATADHFIGRIIIFTSGALENQATDITDYALSGSNGHFTVSALTEAPGNNDTFIII